MSESFERDFKGVWIPKEIFLCKDISPTEKILLAEIHSLDKGEGCYASNKYLAEFVGISEGRLANCLTKLKQLNLIITRKFDGRMRWLSVNSDFTKTGTCIHEKVKSPFTKT